MQDQQLCSSHLMWKYDLIKKTFVSSFYHPSIFLIQTRKIDTVQLHFINILLILSQFAEYWFSQKLGGF